MRKQALIWSAGLIPEGTMTFTPIDAIWESVQQDYPSDLSFIEV